MQPSYPPLNDEVLNQVESLRQQKTGKRKKGLAFFIVLLLLFSFAVIYFRWIYFKVQTIAVSGLEDTSYSEVIAAAEKGGLQLGANLASIDPRLVEKAVNDDYHYIFDRLILDYRKRSALLVVSERKNLAVIEHNGALYSISSDGYVMGTYDGTLNVPKVTGLNIHSAVTGKRLINVSDALQYLRVILHELEMQKLLSSVTQISMTKLDKIILYMDHSQSVILGSGTQIMKKIVSARTVLNLLWRISSKGGETIDVSDPERVRIQYPISASWTVPGPTGTDDR